MDADARRATPLLPLLPPPPNEKSGLLVPPWAVVPRGVLSLMRRGGVSTGGPTSTTGGAVLL
jgi:hypothetical protein